MAGTFSTAQKLSLAGMFIGSVLVVVGLGAPYWLVSDVNLDGFQISEKLVGASMGVFLVCGKVLDHEECRYLEDDDQDSFLYVCRISGAVCVLVGGICGLVALCLACCGRGTRFVCLGVVCFIAAAIGAVAPIVFDKKLSVFTTSFMGMHVASYGWAFYMYCAGVALLGAVSIMACFSAPENPIGGVVFSRPGPSVIVTHTGTHPYVPLEEPGTIMSASATPGVTVVSSNTSY